jgi:hypothetical protein
VRFIWKYTKLDYFLGQVLRVLAAVHLSDAQQNYQAGSDRANGFATDADMSALNTLNDNSHAVAAV